MKIPCKKLCENAILPTRGTALAAGVDLYALLPDGQESAAVAPQGKYLFPTGIAVEIPEGYVGLVFARSGIATAIVLGIGRAIGEAMAVMMVAGNSPNMPDSPFRSVTFLTTAIAKEMSYAGGLQRQALFSIALVLFVFIMIINVVLNVVLKGGSRDE